MSDITQKRQSGALSEAQRYKTYLEQKYALDEALVTSFVFTRKTLGNIGETRQSMIYRTLYFIRDNLMPCNFEDAEIGNIYHVIAQIKDGRYKQNTQLQYIQTFRAFLLWASKNGKLPKILPESIEAIKNPKPQHEVFTPEAIVSDDEIDKLMNNPYVSARDAALIAVAYWTGCRPSEALRLRWKDVTFHTNNKNANENFIEIVIDDTKTGKQRYIPIYRPQAVSALRNWLFVYPYKPYDAIQDLYIFIVMREGENKHMQMSIANFRLILKSLCKKCGITKRITPYSFRRSNITHQAAAGVPESVIKSSHWGNQSTNMLRHYVFIGKDDVKSAIQKMEFKKLN